MKIKLKILTILAIILGAMCLFATNKVEASYAAITKGTLTENSLDNIPSTISLDLKESEFEKVPGLIMEQVTTELKKQEIILEKNFSQASIGSVDVEFEDEKTYTPISSVAWTMRANDIYNISIKAHTNGSNPINVNKTIAIKYNNTQNYNEADKNYVANLVKNNNGTTINVYSSPNVPDTAIGIDAVIEALYKKMNDASIKLIANGGTGDLEKEVMDYAVFKNDVYYQSITATAKIYFVTEDVDIGNNISVSGLLENVSINVTPKETGETAKDMITDVKGKGYTKILGAYELTLAGATSLAKPIDITFSVGTEYNGEMAYILHKKANGEYERFEEKVQNGKVTITVSELSPFVVAVKGDGQEEQQNTNAEEGQVKSGEKDDTPKTGNTNNIYFLIPFIVATTLGIMVYSKKQNK